MIEYISDRLFRNWKTTVVAAIIYGAIGYLAYTGKADLSTLSGWFGMATTFLFVKDPGAERRAERKAAQAQP